MCEHGAHLEQVPCGVDRLELRAGIHSVTHVWVDGDDHELPSFSVLERIVSEQGRSGSHTAWPNQFPRVDLERRERGSEA